MIPQRTVLNPPPDLNTGKPCVSFAAVCRACGSPVLPGHRYCNSCQCGVQEMDRMSIIFPLPKGAIGRKIYSA